MIELEVLIQELKTEYEMPPLDMIGDNVMPLSPYFLQGSTSDQRLTQDLINEQLSFAKI